MSRVRENYQQYIAKLKLKGSITGCILSIVLVPIGISSDYLLYGEFFTEFLYARFGCTTLTLLILWLHFHKTINKSFINLLSFSWLFMIQALICFMILISNNFDLAYYNAVILLIFTASILLPLHIKEITILCLICITSYLLAALNTYISDIGILYNNIFTLIIASIIAITATKLKSKLLFKHFYLNYRLNNKINELRQTQQSLVDKEKNEATIHLSTELIHEINNPLNFTTTALNSLDNLIEKNKNAELEEISQDIRIGTLRIKNTLDNLKNTSLLKKDIIKSKFNLLEAVETAVRLKDEIVRKVHLEISINKNLSINASKTYLIQILINLIENSIYSLNTAKTKSPIIEISARETGNNVELTISDNGQHIENPDFLDNIDETIISPQENKRLDLIIAAKLIKQHPGNLNISINSSKNQICFCLK